MSFLSKAPAAPDVATLCSPRTHPAPHGCALASLHGCLRLRATLICNVSKRTLYFKFRDYLFLFSGFRFEVVTVTFDKTNFRDFLPTHSLFVDSWRARLGNEGKGFGEILFST